MNDNRQNDSDYVNLDWVVQALRRMPSNRRENAGRGRERGGLGFLPQAPFRVLRPRPIGKPAEDQSLRRTALAESPASPVSCLMSPGVSLYLFSLGLT